MNAEGKIENQRHDSRGTCGICRSPQEFSNGHLIAAIGRAENGRFKSKFEIKKTNGVSSAPTVSHSPDFRNRCGTRLSKSIFASKESRTLTQHFHHLLVQDYSCIFPILCVSKRAPTCCCKYAQIRKRAQALCLLELNYLIGIPSNEMQWFRKQ